MKTMKIEKHLIFTDDIKKLVHLFVEEGLSYHKEMDGIRANGPLYIRGDYETQDGRSVNFQEVLEMDVLAPQEKLANEPFVLRIEKFEGLPEPEGILVRIEMSIAGLKEAEEETTAAKPMPMPQPISTPQPVNIPIPAYEEEPTIAVSKREDENEQTEEMTAEESTDDEVNEFEDLFEDADTTYTSYRMIVAKPNDTYTNIANRYEVKEPELRECNHNKQIEAKTLIILP